VSALLTLAWRSAWNRRATLSLVLLSVALSTFLLLGFEQVRTDVRENFSQSVSGTDLVVGARTGSVQLMLYSVFRVGGATNNIRMSSVEAIAQHRAVAWVVPLSLGDSHRGYPVLGTRADYFKRFLYGEREQLALAEGQAFADGIDGLYGVVLGAEVAQALSYQLGDRLVLSHGGGGLPGAEHADKPFTVVGILQRTGTPVDRTVHISLESMEAIHLEWVGGAPMPGMRIEPEQARKFDLAPKQVTAALVGLKSRAAVFNVQRFVADHEGEALMAVLPGVAPVPFGGAANLTAFTRLPWLNSQRGLEDTVPQPFVAMSAGPGGGGSGRGGGGRGGGGRALAGAGLWGGGVGRGRGKAQGLRHRQLAGVLRASEVLFEASVRRVCGDAGRRG
jgi:putative ABC transport system permease protein